MIFKVLVGNILTLAVLAIGAGALLKRHQDSQVGKLVKREFSKQAQGTPKAKTKKGRDPEKPVKGLDIV